MIYNGDLTFDSEDPQNYLKIPGLTEAKRIAGMVLEMYGLRHSVEAALSSLRCEGSIREMLSCYRDFLVQRDVGRGGYVGYDDYPAFDRTHRETFNSILGTFFSSFSKTEGFQLPRVRAVLHMTAAKG